MSILFFFFSMLSIQADTLSLAETETLAIQADWGLKRSEQLVAAQREAIISQQQLPDPKLKLAAANLPVDSLRTGQEPMTQGIIALQQSLPTLNTLALKGEQAQAQVKATQAQQHIQQRQLLQKVRTLWLEVYEAEKLVELLTQKRQLYQELLPIAKSAYKVGHGQQQDIVRVKILLSKLTDKENQLQGQNQAKRHQLAQWLGQHSQRPWPAALPEQFILLPDIPESALSQHPELTQLQAQHQVSQKAVALAREAYRPSFNLEVSYSWRDSYTDMLSFGVVADLPIFQEKRQDKRLAAQQKQQQADLFALQDRQAALGAQQAAYWQQARSQYKRIQHYQRQILPELKQITALVIADYAAGLSDFNALMQAREAEITAAEELVQLQTALARSITVLLYLTQEADDAH
ncbi:MAG: TolC family protein [Pseudomonadota bacterium]|nr:TolC family protein [Pseudomonadota bacterium]